MNSKRCIICETPLIAHLKFYCSGKCIEDAKERGIYGNEKPLPSEIPLSGIESELPPKMLEVKRNLQRDGVLP